MTETERGKTEVSEDAAGNVDISVGRGCDFATGEAKHWYIFLQFFAGSAEHKLWNF